MSQRGAGSHRAGLAAALAAAAVLCALLAPQQAGAAPDAPPPGAVVDRGSSRIVDGDRVTFFYHANAVLPTAEFRMAVQYYIQTTEPKVEGEGIWSIQSPMAAPPPGPDGGTFPYDLRIVCHRAKEAFVRQVLAIIDRPLPHVLVQIRVVENLYTNDMEVGGEATHDVSGVEDTFYTGFTQTFNPPEFLSSQVEGSVFQGLTLDFASVGDSLLQRGPASGKIRFVAGRDDTWIISSSQLLVALGETGKLNAGESVPYQTLTALVGATQVVTDFKQTGVEVEFVPIAIGDNNVILRLKSSVTRVTGFTNQGGVSNPVLSTRSASTTVQLGDGQDYTFGGLVATREFVDHSMIPILGDIPVLGFLFRSFTKRLERREVLFMIRPYLVPLQSGVVPDAVIPSPDTK